MLAPTIKPCTMLLVKIGIFIVSKNGNIVESNRPDIGRLRSVSWVIKTKKFTYGLTYIVI